jgi:hypothetical protein
MAVVEVLALSVSTAEAASGTAAAAVLFTLVKAR